MGRQSLGTGPPHIILDLVKPAPPRPGKQHFSAKNCFYICWKNLNLTFPSSTSQHSCIVGFQETLAGRRNKSNLQRTNGTVKTFSSKGQLWPFLTASIFIFVFNSFKWSIWTNSIFGEESKKAGISWSNPFPFQVSIEGVWEVWLDC